MSGRRCLTTEDAVPAKGQHTRPCSDCPFARTALPGWTGGETVENWLKEAHGDDPMPCHVLNGAQCAGAAIYRRNVAKSPRDPDALVLGADREAVFAGPHEFRKHHERTGPARCRAATTGAPQGASQTDSEGDGQMADTKAIKAKHAAQISKVRAAADARVAKAEAKGKKAVDKVVGDILGIDKILEAAGNTVDNLTAAGADKAKKELAKLLTKIGKIVDKYLS